MSPAARDESGDAAVVAASVRGRRGVKPGFTTDAAAEIKRLQKENAELRKANEILKAASVFFAKELDRP